MANEKAVCSLCDGGTVWDRCSRDLSVMAVITRLANKIATARPNKSQSNGRISGILDADAYP